MGRLSRTYLRLLGVFMAVSCLGLLFLPRVLGARTPWGAAPGWQREIAFWNISMYIVIVGTIRRADRASGRLLVAALVVLNCLVAANHFAAVIQGGASLNYAVRRKSGRILPTSSRLLSARRGRGGPSSSRRGLRREAGGPRRPSSPSSRALSATFSSSPAAPAATPKWNIPA
jgi:hypothetical protein